MYNVLTTWKLTTAANSIYHIKNKYHSRLNTNQHFSSTNISLMCVCVCIYNTRINGTWGKEPCHQFYPNKISLEFTLFNIFINVMILYYTIVCSILSYCYMLLAKIFFCTSIFIICIYSTFSLHSTMTTQRTISIPILFNKKKTMFTSHIV